MTKEAWQAGLPADEEGLGPVLSSGSAIHWLFSGQEPGPTGLGGGRAVGRKNGTGLCPGMEQGILVDCVCMCVCVGASQLPLSVERVQVAGNRGERKPRQSARARGRPSGDHWRFRKQSMLLPGAQARGTFLGWLDSPRLFVCCVSLPFLRRLFLKILAGLG